MWKEKSPEDLGTRRRLLLEGDSIWFPGVGPPLWDPVSCLGLLPGYHLVGRALEVRGPWFDSYLVPFLRSVPVLVPIFLQQPVLGFSVELFSDLVAEKQTSNRLRLEIGATIVFLRMSPVCSLKFSTV